MKKRNIIIVSALVILLALSLAWPLYSPLFINNVVNEEFPIVKDSITQEPTTIEEPQSQLSGIFQDADSFHKTSGEANIYEIEGEEYLRLENFKTTNGPDLFVYLATDEQASEFVNLGELKGNIGNQNYEIPKGTDLSKYDKVLIWCEDFSVLFGSANIK